MKFLKEYGIHLDKVEHRNWAIRITLTVLFIAWWNSFQSRMEMDPTRIDQLGAIFAAAYVLGMIIWMCVGFHYFNEGWYDEPKGENSINFDLDARVHFLAASLDKYSSSKWTEELNYLKEKYKSELKGFDKKEKILKKEREENLKKKVQIF